MKLEEIAVRKLAVGSLFSGIGGIEYGLEQTGGFRTIWQSEIDPYASAVLHKHWPDVPNLGDITKIDWGGVERPDMLCGGFPCQDISVAGKGKGIKEGTRSGLWFEYARAIRSLRPRLALIENVPMLARRGLNIVLADLAEMGYDAEWFTLSAQEVGAWHKRERLFILAYPISDGYKHKVGRVDEKEEGVANVNREDDSPPRELSGASSIRISSEGYVPNANNTGNSSPRCKADGERQETHEGRERQPQPKPNGQGDAISNSISAGTGMEEHRDSGQNGNKARTPESEILRQEHRESCAEGIAPDSADVSDSESERLNRGICGDSEDGKRSVLEHKKEWNPNWSEIAGCCEIRREEAYWQVEPDVDRVADGIPSRVDRIKCLGNAVVPQVAQVIGQAMLEVENNGG
jgi:DNA-cytosine methyltransferase